MDHNTLKRAIYLNIRVQPRTPDWLYRTCCLGKNQVRRAMHQSLSELIASGMIIYWMNRGVYTITKKGMEEGAP